VSEESIFPVFPIEFVVAGTPRSLQGSPEGVGAWKEQVRATAGALIPGHCWATDRPVTVTIYNFPDGPMQADLDNIIKPILDALSGLVFVDDQQVSELRVTKFEPGTAITFDAVTSVLSDALEGDRPLVYIRIDAEIVE